MKKGIIVILLLIIVLGAAGTYFFLIAPQNEEKAGKKASEPLLDSELTMFSVGDAFITNAAGGDAKRLIKVNVVLGLTEAEAAEELTLLIPVIRDVVITALREKSAEDYLSMDIQDKLREELVPKITDRLGVDYIQTMYFYDLCLQ